MRQLRLYLFLLLTIVSNCSLATSDIARILVMGDSLSAGYGIDIQQGWVNLLEQALTKNNKVSITNASVSGETSSGGLARLPALLKKHQPTLVILELGGNDGLRGQPLKLLEKNMQAMINASHASGAKVILAGMQIPPNYGSRYTHQFKALYPKLAEKNSLVLIPFLLEGVAGNSDLIQPDGIHPTAEAQPLIMKIVLPFVQQQLQH
jgi:acyl-CoA thioesterase I